MAWPAVDGTPGASWQGEQLAADAGQGLMRPLPIDDAAQHDDDRGVHPVVPFRMSPGLALSLFRVASPQIRTIPPAILPRNRKVPRPRSRPIGRPVDPRVSNLAPPIVPDWDLFEENCVLDPAGSPSRLPAVPGDAPGVVSGRKPQPFRHPVRRRAHPASQLLNSRPTGRRREWRCAVVARKILSRLMPPSELPQRRGYASQHQGFGDRRWRPLWRTSACPPYLKNWMLSR